MLVPAPAGAQVLCIGGTPPPGSAPIDETRTALIVCNNPDDRTNPAGDVIQLDTNTNAGAFIHLTNSGWLTGFGGDGIDLRTSSDDSPITVDNGGPIGVSGGGDVIGISVRTADLIFSTGDRSPISITSRAQIGVSAGQLGIGIDAVTVDNDSPISITSSGGIAVTAEGEAQGIIVSTTNAGSPISITSSGDIAVTTAGPEEMVGFHLFAIGIGAIAFNAPVTITSSSDIDVNAGNDGAGIASNVVGNGTPLTIANSGDFTVNAGDSGSGIQAFTVADGNAITVVSSGDFAVSAEEFAHGIRVVGRANGPVSVTNSGDLGADGVIAGYGIQVLTFGPGSPINVANSGAVRGNTAGLWATDATSTTIRNLAGGHIFADSGLAIDVDGLGAAGIFSAGRVSGFIDLTDNGDTFINQATGVFNARLTSDFGAGADLFTNEVGGLVATAGVPGLAEPVQFINLERFENFGRVSLVDGGAGDEFIISNTPGGADLEYWGGGQLAVDASLGGPAPAADTLRVDGNVSGVTDVIVYNTGAPGVFDPEGVTVVQVGGSVDASAFRLADGPIGSGFFAYDLFFEPRDGGLFNEFELRSFPGAGAFVLPQLVTASQDVWHQTSDTWFDRSSDLRTQLFKSAGEGSGVVAGGGGPALWARGSGASLSRDAAAGTSAFGRSYSFNLDRELQVGELQLGVDASWRGLLREGDTLIVSAFVGGVWADLGYENVNQRFDLDGWQAGVAATYLTEDLFVDAVLSGNFLDVEAHSQGFPASFDAESYGLRIDSGYRFDMDRFFIEPLATLSYVNTDLTGFTVGGNQVSFGAADSLRGRIGLRLGSSLELGGGRVEPFLSASYWGELLDDDNAATLTSNGTGFSFADQREDSWGEVSLGVNLFLSGSNAVSAFGKADFTFGGDSRSEAISGGFRVVW